MAQFRSFRFNPVIDTSAYAPFDQLGPTSTKITGVLQGGASFVKLQSIVVVDNSKQKAQIDFLFWNSLPTIASVDNGAFDLTDAQAAAKYIGRQSVVTADYIDSSSNSLGYASNLNKLLKAVKSTDNNDGRDLWFTMVVAAGTPTFAALALQLELEFEVY